jgi:integrase
MRKPLTQRLIDTTPLPKAGFTELRDHGLVVRIHPTGKRSFSLEYRSPMTKKSARITLFGPTLAEARGQAAEQRRLLAEGRDPTVERQETLTARRIEYARSKDVAEAVRLYEVDFTRHIKMVSRRERMAKLRRAVEPFNDRPVASLTRGELVSRLDAIQSESGPVARNRAHAEIRAWLAWLLEREHVPAVVLAGVKKRAVETARTRVLTDEELGAIARITTDGAPFSDIVRVLLHTGMRKSEAANLQARDIDFGARTITVRAEVSKTNRERVIPMIDAIALMLNGRSEGLRPDVYLFGLRGDAPFSGWGNATNRMRDAMAGNDWTLHDIRRTVATRLHDAGVDPLVIEDLLGHLGGVRGGMAGVYNRSVTLAKQREALNDWADKLAALMGDNVMPMHYTTKRGYAGR